MIKHGVLRHNDYYYNTLYNGEEHASVPHTGLGKVGVEFFFCFRLVFIGVGLAGVLGLI